MMPASGMTAERCDCSTSLRADVLSHFADLAIAYALSFPLVAVAGCGFVLVAIWVAGDELRSAGAPCRA